VKSDRHFDHSAEIGRSGEVGLERKGALAVKVAGVEAQAGLEEGSEGSDVGSVTARPEGDGRRSAGLDQEFAGGLDQVELVLGVEAGQLEAGALGDPFGDALPDRVEMELHFLSGGEDRLDHAADRLDAVDQGRHRIDEEAGLEAVIAKAIELAGIEGGGKVLAPGGAASMSGPAERRIDREENLGHGGHDRPRP
jgi:hypothetical protein